MPKRRTRCPAAAAVLHAPVRPCLPAHSLDHAPAPALAPAHRLTLLLACCSPALDATFTCGSPWSSLRAGALTWLYHTDRRAPVAAEIPLRSGISKNFGRCARQRCAWTRPALPGLLAARDALCYLITDSPVCANFRRKMLFGGAS